MLSKLLNRYISQKNLYFFILLVITIIFLWKNMDISLLLFISIIFATALNPLVNKLEKKIKRPLATTIVVVSFVAVSALIIFPILKSSIYEIENFANEFPQYITNINKVIQKMPILKAVGITSLNTDTLTKSVTNSSTDIFKNVMDFISQASAVLLYLFTGIILIFFFLVDKDIIKESILKLFPIEYREKTSNIFEVLNNKLSGYVFAQTLVSGSVWIIMTIGLLLFKIQYAFALGLIAGVLSIIPIVGSGLSLIICLMATLEMGWKYLLIVTILYTISHFIENHVVRPYVYSKFLKIHQIIIFLALIVGAKYQGVLGIIIAPAFAMALCVLLEELYIKKMDENILEDKQKVIEK